MRGVSQYRMEDAEKRNTFFFHLGPQDEIQSPCDYKGGHEDFTFNQWMSMKAGPKGNFLAIREKLNGTSLCRFNHIMSGPVHFDWSGDQQMMEWTEKGLFVIYPWAVPAHAISGVPIYSHPWKSPNQLEYAAEGAMVLWRDSHSIQEYRWKRRATVEVLDEGITWEVSLTGSSEWYPIRPRPGLTPTTDLRVKFPLFREDLMPPADFEVLEVRPSSSSEFIVESAAIEVHSPYGVVEGSLVRIVQSQHSSVQDEEIVKINIDQVRVLEPYLPLNSEQYSMVKSKHLTYLNKVTGAKAILKIDGLWALIKESPEKKWDHIGGTLNFDEKPTTALRREVMEEVHIRLTCDDFEYVGFSEENNKDTFTAYSTYLYTLFRLPYTCRLMSSPPNPHLIEVKLFSLSQLAEDPDVAPWAYRLAATHQLFSELGKQHFSRFGSFCRLAHLYCLTYIAQQTSVLEYLAKQGLPVMWQPPLVKYLNLCGVCFGMAWYRRKGKTMRPISSFLTPLAIRGLTLEAICLKFSFFPRAQIINYLLETYKFDPGSRSYMTT